MATKKIKRLLEGAFLALDMELSTPSENTIMMAGSMAVARDRIITALSLINEEEHIADYTDSILTSKGQEDIFNAVHEATKALFSGGLSPEDTRIALITLKGTITSLLEEKTH